MTIIHLYMHYVLIIQKPSSSVKQTKHSVSVKEPNPYYKPGKVVAMYVNQKFVTATSSHGSHIHETTKPIVERRKVGEMIKLYSVSFNIVYNVGLSFQN